MDITHWNQGFFKVVIKNIFALSSDKAWKHVTNITIDGQDKQILTIFFTKTPPYFWRKQNLHIHVKIASWFFGDSRKH